MVTRSSLLAATLLACSAAAHAGSIAGAGFGMSYDDSDFVYQTGEQFNGDTNQWEPVYQTFGGFSLVAPNTVRFHLRPDEVVPGIGSPDPAFFKPGGNVAVTGGGSTYSDSQGDTLDFRLAAAAGYKITGVKMNAAGWYDNSGTESATLSNVEWISAFGEWDGFASALGVYSSGALPTGSNISFAGGLTEEFMVEFMWALSASSSDPMFTSTLNIDYIDFQITAAPVPEPSTLALTLLGLGGLMARRRKAD